MIIVQNQQVTYTFGVDENGVDSSLHPTIADLTSLVEDRIVETSVKASVDQQSADAVSVHVIRETNTDRADETQSRCRKAAQQAPAGSKSNRITSLFQATGP